MPNQYSSGDKPERTRAQKIASDYNNLRKRLCSVRGIGIWRGYVPYLSESTILAAQEFEDARVTLMASIQADAQKLREAGYEVESIIE